MRMCTVILGLALARSAPMPSRDLEFGSFPPAEPDVRTLMNIDTCPSVEASGLCDLPIFGQDVCSRTCKGTGDDTSTRLATIKAAAQATVDEYTAKYPDEQKHQVEARAITTIMKALPGIKAQNELPESFGSRFSQGEMFMTAKHADKFPKCIQIGYINELPLSAAITKCLDDPKCDGFDFPKLRMVDPDSVGSGFMRNCNCVDSGVGIGSDGVLHAACPYPADGDCDDGGVGSDYSLCKGGTDCSDCGEADRSVNFDNDAGRGWWVKKRLLPGEELKTSLQDWMAEPDIRTLLVVTGVGGKLQKLAEIAIGTSSFGVAAASTAVTGMVANFACGNFGQRTFLETVRVATECATTNFAAVQESALSFMDPDEITFSPNSGILGGMGESQMADLATVSGAVDVVGTVVGGVILALSDCMSTFGNCCR